MAEMICNRSRPSSFKDPHFVRAPNATWMFPLLCLLLTVFIPKILLHPVSAQILPRSSSPDLSNTSDLSLSISISQTSKNDTAELSSNLTSMAAATEGLLNKIFEMKDRVLISAHIPPVSIPPRNAVLLDSFLLRTGPVSTIPITEPSTAIPTTTPSAPHQARFVSEESPWERNTAPVNATMLPRKHSVSTTSIPPGAYPVTPTTAQTVSTTRSMRGAKPENTRKQIVTGRPNFFYLGDNVDSDEWWSGETVAPEVELVDGESEGSRPQSVPVDPSRNWFPTTSSHVQGGLHGAASFGQELNKSVISSDSQNQLNVTKVKDVPEPFRLPTTNGLQQPAQSAPAFPVTVDNRTRNSDETNQARGGELQGAVGFATTPPSTENPFYAGTRSANDTSPIQQRPGTYQDVPISGPGTSSFDPDASRKRMQGTVMSAPYPGGNDRISPPFRRYPVPPNGLDSNPKTNSFGIGDPQGRPDGPWNRARPPLPPPFVDVGGGGVTHSTDDGIKLETCSIGDDSTCNQEGHEVCRRDDGVSTCVCRTGTVRKRAREPCQGALNYYVYVRMNRLFDRILTYGPQFADNSSYPYQTLSREVTLGIESLLRSSDLNEFIISAKVNSFAPFSDDLLANVTVTFAKQNLDASAFASRLQDTMLDKLKLTDRRLGSSRLFVGSLLNAVPGVQDMNECLSSELNDCNMSAICTNTPGTYSCICKPGYVDRNAGDPLRSGRNCEACEETFCNQHGICLMGPEGKMCQCNGWYIGAQCQTDGQVVAVACGSSAIAVILIAITLLFLLRWSRSNSSQRGFHLTDPSSTLARSEISANTFTYVKGQNSEIGLEALSQFHGHSTLDNKVRLTYLVHPNLVTQMPAHQRNQLLDSNFYEVRPPLTNVAKARPVYVGPNQSHVSGGIRRNFEHLENKRSNHSGDGKGDSRVDEDNAVTAPATRQPPAQRQCSF